MSNWLRRQVWIWALTACLPLCAQEFRAGIRGIVKDAQGAVVPGAKVEAKNVGAGDISATTTNGSGYYVFPVLPPGTYRFVAATPKEICLCRSLTTLLLCVFDFLRCAAGSQSSTTANRSFQWE